MENMKTTLNIELKLKCIYKNKFIYLSFLNINEYNYEKNLK